MIYRSGESVVEYYDFQLHKISDPPGVEDDPVILAGADDWIMPDD